MEVGQGSHGEQVGPAAWPGMRRHVLARTFFAETRRAARWRCIAGLMGLVFGLASLRLPLESLAPQFSLRKDLLQEWLLARAIADGTDPYLSVSVLAERYLGPLTRAVFPHPTPHPPTVGLLFLPLSWLSYYWAAAVWLALEMCCLVASVRLLSQAVGSRLSWHVCVGASLGLLAWYPFSFELGFGQMMIPMLALLAGSWAALGAGDDLLAGALLGVALLLKPVPWPLLLVLALGRRWRSVVGVIGVVGVGYAAAIALIGLPVVTDYFSRVVPLVSAAYRADPWNFSLSSLPWKILSGTGSRVIVGLEAPPLIVAPQLAPLLSTAVAGLVLAAATWWLWPGRGLGAAYGVVAAVSILVAPISWSHYLVLLAIPMAVVLRWLSGHGWPSRETNIAMLLTMVLWLDWGSLVDILTGVRGAQSGIVQASFAMSMVTQIPALGVCALIVFLAGLDGRGSDLVPQVAAHAAAKGQTEGPG